MQKIRYATVQADDAPVIQREDLSFVAPMVPLPVVYVQFPQVDPVVVPVALVPVYTEPYRVAPVSVPLTPVVSVVPLQSEARFAAMIVPSRLYTGEDAAEVPVRLTALKVESERSGYHVVPARAGTAFASPWHKVRAPSRPPRLPF